MVAWTPFERHGRHVLPAHGSTCPSGGRFGKGIGIDAACKADTQRQGPVWSLTTPVV